MDGYEKATALWQKKNITNDAELAEALNGHGIAFAYHSGRIENENITYHDTREIFEHDGVTSYTGSLRTLFEIRNAKEAYELFLTAFRDRRPVDGDLVKEFQQVHSTYLRRVLLMFLNTVPYPIFGQYQIFQILHPICNFHIFSGSQYPSIS